MDKSRKRARVAKRSTEVYRLGGKGIKGGRSEKTEEGFFYLV